MTPIIKMSEMMSTSVVKDVFSHLADDVTIYDTSTYDLDLLKRGDIVLCYEPIEYGRYKSISSKGVLVFRMSYNPMCLRSNYFTAKV